MASFELLVVEDSEVKWREIHSLLLNMQDVALSIERAKTIDEANRLISDKRWSLILLDISMDIRESASDTSSGGHDTTGGLRVAQRMYYLERDAPIIIVTAFDSFPTRIQDRGAMLGLNDVLASASGMLGDLLIGLVKYQEDGWEDKLSKLIRTVIDK
tara:strand:- start:357 stop:830 length:474 start_codon:yes stop_codon:yes gene_type:complete